jgi:hypothetical protein
LNHSGNPASGKDSRFALQIWKHSPGFHPKTSKSARYEGVDWREYWLANLLLFKMMKTLLSLSLLLLAQLCHADEAAVNTARIHLSSYLKGDHTKLSETYAPKVALMPGHEFLKEEYGLNESGDRAKGAEVERDKLIAAMVKVSADRPARLPERIDEMLETLSYEPIKIEEGDFVTDSSDPVGTPDGKLHFSIKNGDVLLKVSPPKGDYLLLHLREKDGKWRVVSEYLD